ncbi:MAG TPA: hypothetical protein VJA94_01295, partial [Candidatus Angelobacter sp.]
MRRSIVVLCIVASIAFLFGGAGLAQAQTGLPPFSSGMSFGPAWVNLANLDIHVSAPVFAKPGRGVPLNYTLAYDTLGVPNADWMGWTRTGPAGWMQVYDTTSQYCYLNQTFYNVIGFSTYHDANGGLHLPGGLVVGPSDDPCNYHAGDTGTLGDGSGWSYVVTQALSIDFLLPDGTLIEPLHVRCTGSPSVCTSVGGGTIMDSNGNLLYEQLSPNPNQIVDTTATAFAVSGDYWTIQSLGYTDSNGVQQEVNVSYGSGNAQTNYGCSNIHDFPATAVGSQLVKQISYPDGSSMQFGYEPTPGFPTSTTGRIASITLRTGGTINFAYTGSHDGINCTDGSMAGISVTTSDNGTWTFQRTLGTGTATTTTVTDPDGNQMVISFLGGFETQRQIYQGSSASGTLLQTITKCYNGNKSNCTTTTTRLPVTELSVIQALPNGEENEQDTFFNMSELQTEIDDYGFASNQAGSLLRKIFITYASLGNNILNHPASVTVCSPSGTDAACNGSGTRLAQTTFGYDEGTLTTSGAGMHSGVSGSHGNLT